MSLISKPAGFLLTLLVLTAWRTAQAQAPAPTNAQTFQVTTTRHELEGVGYYFRAVAAIGTNQFVFIVPKGYFIRVDEPNRLVRAVEREDKCSISVQLITLPTNAVDKATLDLKPDAFRELLLQQYPNARVLETLSLSAGGTTGPAFDFAWRNEAGFELHNRVAFIPTVAGVVEFNLLTSAALREESSHALNHLMLTFRIAEKGKLELPELSNKF